eukprot:TRINITY_DN110_c1_g2_i1.p1 TRINITY_DN110_c1_g2~~TRINITY_DN110_c1_g2_i1.p1  ORF type:complete len:526 (+),score=357.40 TRINITY_DN110_c1_g2_i1:78-1655(+)
MLVLLETPAGFALFKVLNDDKLKKPDNLYKEFESVDSAQKIVKLEKFHKFEGTNEAVAAASALNDNKVGKSLSKFLKKSIVSKGLKDQLGVIDSKLGSAIKEKLGINTTNSTGIDELIRGLRSQMAHLITGLQASDLQAMTLGLAHSLSRFKIKLSPDKVDTMIVQAVGLLDDLDKELNTYSMRSKEWYGWHFPELTKIIPDNLLYARTVKLLGIRSSTKVDLSSVLPEELEKEVHDAAQISMGTEINDFDMLNISELCDQVIEMHEYREELFEYLKNRMHAIAPNLTVLVGELVGARLISHAGSLINLAKHPASTIQILGAEKALFRALKTKHATPKYGLIYHASLVGQSSAKNKGKMSRIVANKAALSIRVDALGDSETAQIGEENLERCERKLQQLEGREIVRSVKVPPKGAPRYDHTRSSEDPTKMKDVETYNEKSDAVLGTKRAREEPASSDDEEPKKKKAKKEEEPKKDKKKDKKKEKKSKKDDSSSEDEAPKKKSKKDKKEKKEKKEKKDKKKDKKKK